MPSQKNPEIYNIIIWDVIVPTVLGLIGWYFFQDRELALIVFLNSCAIILISQLRLQLNKASDKLINFFSLQKEITADSFLNEKLNQIIEDYNILKENKDDLFFNRVQEQLEICTNEISYLQQGRIELRGDDIYDYSIKLLEKSQNLFATHLVKDPISFDPDNPNSYFRKGCDLASQKKLKIKRVFIAENKDAFQAEDVRKLINEHFNSNIEVLIALNSNSNYNMAIFDDKYVAYKEREKLTVYSDDNQLAQAKKVYQSLLKSAKQYNKDSFNEFLKDKTV